MAKPHIEPLNANIATVKYPGSTLRPLNFILLYQLYTLKNKYSNLYFIFDFFQIQI
jgi:hypothetical protein